MAIVKINLGNVVNDGLGDDLRTAFQKVNSNFASLETSLIVTASNAAGNSGSGIVAESTGSVLKFKNLIAGNKIILENYSNAIKISSTQLDGFESIITNNGTISASSTANLLVVGGKNITTSVIGNTVEINTKLDVDSLVNSFDFGPIAGPSTNVIQLLLSIANIDFGTILMPGSVMMDLGTL